MKPVEYLKGINGLRAIAAISVVIFHINRSLNEFNLDVKPTLDLAGFGVTIFFSISGFLITYLLLKEKEIHPIDIKKFYVRRILRIWPLYFLVLALSLITTFLFIPISLHQPLPYYLVYFIFSPNIAFSLGVNFPLLGHYWSLGVEEQFYMFWPWIIRNTKKTFKVVLLFTIIFIFCRLIFRFIEYKFGYSLPYYLIHDSRFDCMSIGAIGAYLLHQKNALFLKITMYKAVQILSWLVIVLLLLNYFHIASVIDHELVSIVTVVLIINLSQNKKTLVNLDFPVFNFLGKISFGIYMVHQLVIFYTAMFIGQIQLEPIFKYLLIYTTVLGGTIFFAYLSYEFFEKRFLILKDKYSFVKSTF